jgi:hypothetical protein
MVVVIVICRIYQVVITMKILKRKLFEKKTFLSLNLFVQTLQ